MMCSSCIDQTEYILCLDRLNVLNRVTPIIKSLEEQIHLLENELLRNHLLNNLKTLKCILYLF